MSRMPKFLLRHVVTVEAYEGSNATGDVYGAPQQVRCLLVVNPRLVRNASGDEVMSNSSYLTLPDHVPTEGSRVTLADGSKASVVAVTRVTAPGLPTPDNTEVHLN